MKFNKKYLLEGEIAGLFLCGMPNSIESTPCSQLELDINGIIGDKHYGFQRPSGVRETNFYPKGTTIRNNRQWSAISAEELDKITHKMNVPHLKSEWLGANILFKGIPNFSKLPIFSLIIVRPDTSDSVTLVNYCENEPCMGPHKRIVEHLKMEPQLGFIAAAYGQRGTVGWVEKGGIVRVGDKVRIYIPS